MSLEPLLTYTFAFLSMLTVFSIHTWAQACDTSRALGACTIQLQILSNANVVSCTLRESYSCNTSSEDKTAILGSDANGDGDKSRENATLPDAQEAEQTDMSTLALDHAEYEPLPENSDTGKPAVRCFH